MKVELVRPKAFLDISISGNPIGRIVIQLYDDLAPNASLNFLNLCTGTENYSYRHNRFHRVVKNFVIQAGDVINCSSEQVLTFPPEKIGAGSVSTLNQGQLFPLENGSQPLDGPFYVCCANNGDPNANGSQFFITTYPQPHLTGKHTVFGHVDNGKSIVREIELVRTNAAHFPTAENQICIDDCGEWTESMPAPVYNASYNPIGGDIYEEFPDDDPHIDKESSELVYKACDVIKTSGSLLLKQGNHQEAVFKYRKCLRYVMEYIPDIDQEPEWYHKYYDAKKKLYLNITLAYLQLQNYTRAIDYGSYLLDMEGLSKSDLTKALSRRGVAYLNMKKYDKAVEDLSKALEILPNDEGIKVHYKKAEEAKESSKKEERNRYAKFFL